MSGEGLSAAEIARLAGAEFGGDALDFGEALNPGVGPIRRVSAVATAGPDALVFAEAEAVLGEAVASRAGLILAPRDASAQDGRVLRVSNPRLAFARCAEALRTVNRAQEVEVHPRATVDPTARLGARVRVAAGAVIGAGAMLGDDVQIGRNAVIEDGVVLGDRVTVQAGAVLGSLGFGYVRDMSTGEYLLFPQQGGLVIEDDVEIGANTTIDRGALGETRIGRGTKIDNLVHIGHNCRVGAHVVIAAQVGISGSCVIEDGAVLAGQVGISDHCHIGPGVILGGQAGVYRGKTVTGAGEIFAGTPAEPLRDQMRGLAQLRAMARPKRRR